MDSVNKILAPAHEVPDIPVEDPDDALVGDELDSCFFIKQVDSYNFQPKNNK